MGKAKKCAFVAIGVGQGDAFFLQKPSMTVLIDGGRAAHGFPNQFQRVAKLDGVDILVCTHNDADHALGILGFLRSGLTSREVWLPGSWTDRLEDILLHPEGFAEELILNTIEETEVSSEGRLLLQSLGDRYSEGTMQQERHNEGVTSTDALSEAFETAIEIEPYESMFWPYLEYGLWRMLKRDHGRFQLFVEAISAATRIRDISLAAYHTGALIRWFEFDTTFNSGGIPHFLVPLNAREIVRIHRRRWTALEYLALTISNRQSLVFISPANDDDPPILLTSDSDLSFSQPIPWGDGMIITAPHHGSEANAYAYKRFIKETSNSIDAAWVRSDGRFKTRPGSSYLSAYGSRFCTLCRGSNHSKQDVRLTFAARKWKPVLTRKCCCV